MNERLVGEYNLSLADSRCHLDEVTEEMDLWENHGFLVRGESPDGVDVTLWTSPYIVKRGAESYYASQQNISQTVLVAGEFSRADKQVMNDNDFVAVGWSPADYLPFGTIDVEHAEDKTVWNVGDRRFTDAPPHWEIQGEHAGVDLDLAFDAYVPAFDVYPHSGLAETGAGWFEAYLKFAGKIGYQGRSIELDGFACHERVIITRDHVPEKLRDDGLNWHHLFGDRVQTWTMTSPSAGEGISYVVVDGETYKAEGPDDVVIEDLDHWVDPRSWIRVPYRWRHVVETPGGTLDVVAGAYARAYYIWPPFADAINVLYWMSAEANGSFTTKQGEVIPIHEAKYMGHSNRVLFSRT